VRQLLADRRPVYALLAPSYPAAYEQLSAGEVVAALRHLGFARVLEVGFGAEMVARAYAEYLAVPTDRPLISTPCPALVSYVEKYLPELVPNLVPLVSPMIALGRAVKQHYEPGAATVFIGPCTAKKLEARRRDLAGAIDAVLTFQELEEMLAEEQTAGAIEWGESPADEPLPHLGALFPVSGGLLKAAALQADLMDDSIVVVEGTERCLSALRALKSGEFSAQFLDALLCEGCIAGPAYSCEITPLARKEKVTAHVRSLESTQDVETALGEVADVDLTREFLVSPATLVVPSEHEIRDILAQTNKFTVEQELNCGACGYPTCREKAIAVYQGLAEPEMCLPYLIDQLQVNLERINRSQEEIGKAREAASRAQQLAAMGELAADLAQEISNPLGKVVVFAQLLRDTIAEGDERRDEVTNIIAEALHCRSVLSGLQTFAHQRDPHWEKTSLQALVDQALEELRPLLAGEELMLEVELEPDLPEFVADPGQLRQVLVSLLNNSLEALERIGRIRIHGRRAPRGEALELEISDDGPGIDPEILPRLFEPFVSTKRGEAGAGLSLAAAQRVMQSHGGDIHVESDPEAGTRITLLVPLQPPKPETRESIRVLLVDDDPDFLEQHRIMLSSAGFEVVTAERSDEALDIADRALPDAFVLDMMMEQTDSGARLARQLRRDPRFREVPIIMLTSVGETTGFEFRRNPQEVLEWMRADAWFDKPAPMAELANALRRLLDQGGEASPLDIP
jgi:signal transduction histidine kinase/CheY-like chemotaxis protein